MPVGGGAGGYIPMMDRRMDGWKGMWVGEEVNASFPTTDPLPDLLRYQSTASYQCTNTYCETYGTARTWGGVGGGNEEVEVETEEQEK